MQNWMEEQDCTKCKHYAEVYDRCSKKQCEFELKEVNKMFNCKVCGKEMTIADYLISPICHGCTTKQHKNFLKGVSVKNAKGY